MRKVLMFLLLGLFLISFTSAVQFNNIGRYTEETKTISIYENALADYPLMNVTLLSDLNVKTGYGGEFEVFRFEVENYGDADYKDFMKALDIYNINDNMRKVYKDIDLYYITNGSYTEPVYYSVCDNPSNYSTCESVQNGTRTVYTEVLNKLNPSDVKKGQEMIIVGKTWVDKGDRYEWIPEFEGVRVEEWASWAANLDTNIYAYYSLNETTGTVLDYVGLQNGTVTGSINRTANGATANTNFSYEWTADSQKISLGTTNFRQAWWDSDFSISMWYKTGTIASGTDYIVWAGDVDFSIWRNGANIVFLYYDGTVRSAITDSLSTDTWYHLTFTREKATGMKIYVNGVLNASNSLTGNGNGAYAGSTNLGYRNTASETLDGNLDEVGFWSRDLTSGEAEDLASGVTPWYGGAPSTSLTVNLLSPANATNSSDNTPTLTWNYTKTGAIEATNSTLWIDGSIAYYNTTDTLADFSYTDTLTDGDFHLWEVSIEGNDSTQYNSSEVWYYAWWNNNTASLLPTLLTPANATNSSDNTPTLTYNVSIIEDGEAIEIDSVTLWIDGVAVYTNTSGLTNYEYTDTLTDGDFHLWVVGADGNDSTQYNSTETWYYAWWNNDTLVTTTLNSPSDLATLTVPQVFNASAVSNQKVVNASLYTNISGAWALNETINTTEWTNGTLDTTTTTHSITNLTYAFDSSNSTYAEYTYSSSSEDVRHVGIGKNFTSENIGDVYIKAEGIYDGITPSFTLELILQTYNGTDWANETTLNDTTVVVGGQRVVTYDNFYSLDSQVSGVRLLFVTGSDNNNDYFGRLYTLEYEAPIKSTSTTFSKTFIDSVNWNVEFCTIDGICNFSSSNRTALLDIEAPQLTLTAPTGYYTYGRIGNTTNLNWNVSDTSGLDVCIYNYNSANNTVTCTDNITSFNLADTTQQILFWANDTSGNINSTSTTWDYNILEIARDYNAGAQATSTIEFEIELEANATLTDVDFYYNGTAYNTTKATNNYTVSLSAPADNGNYTFYWNATYGSENIITDSNYQTISNISIDDCSVNTIVMLNYTIYDEDTRAFLNTAVENITSNIYVKLGEDPTGDTYELYNLTTTSNPITICIADALTVSQNYRLDSGIQYTADDYVTEFYYVQNATLNVSNAPKVVPLYLLETTNAQEFLITYKDSYSNPVQNAFIEITREYLDLYDFLTVEISKTDNSGQTVGHFVLSDEIYTIYVKKDGVLLATFENVRTFCNDVLTGDCTINLNALSSTANPEDFTYDKGIISTYSYDNNTRELTFSYTSQDGSSKRLNVTIYKMTTSINATMCTEALNSSSGTITCTIPAIYGTDLAKAVILVDDEEHTSFMFNVRSSLGGVLNSGRYILAFILVITLPLIAIGSAPMMLVMFIVGLITAGGLFLVDWGGYIGPLSALLWFIISAIILMVKANSRRQTV